MTEHQVGARSAGSLADRVLGIFKVADTPEGDLKQAMTYVDTMYGGPKAALRPLHDHGPASTSACRWAIPRAAGD